MAWLFGKEYNLKIILGGSFDPVHNGHITLALNIFQQFHHTVDFLPLCGTPNYKAPPKASLHQRLEMLSIVQKLYPKEIGIDYSESSYNNYTPTYLTLKRMRTNYTGALFFIIGSDSLLSLESWDHWEEILLLCNLIVVNRPNYSISNLTARLAEVIIPRIRPDPDLQLNQGQVIMARSPESACSSTWIRNTCSHGGRLDKDLVPSAIADYIYQNNLYKTL